MTRFATAQAAAAQAGVQRKPAGRTVARVFMTGRSPAVRPSMEFRFDTLRTFQQAADQTQAVRLPKEFRFDTDRVIVRREGRHVVLSPLFEDWDDYLENGAPFTDDFFEAMDELRNTHVPPEERASFD